MTIGSRISAIRPRSGIFDGFSIWITSPLLSCHLVDDRRRGRDQVLVELALEPLLDDLHVQQAEEAAAEAEAERLADLGLVAQRRVVELELLERVAQLVVLARLGRVEAGEDLRLDLLEARAAPRWRRPALFGSFFSSVIVSPTLAACSSLMPAMTKPTSPAESLSRAPSFGREDAELLGAVDGVARHQADPLAALESWPSTTRTSMTTPT